jgi:single-strand DNA-binding protein
MIFVMFFSSFVHVDLLGLKHLFFNFLCMRSFNQVLLIGRLAADPVHRVLQPSGKSVLNFVLAVQRDWYRTSSHASSPVPQQEIPTDFFRVIVWGKFADFCNKYLKKGMSTFISGHLVTRFFEGKSGKQVVYEIMLDHLNILSWPKGLELKDADASREFEEVQDLEDLPVTIEEMNDDEVLADPPHVSVNSGVSPGYSMVE